MNFPEQIETERLTLKVPSLADAESIFNSYAQDAKVTRFMTWRPHKGISETESYLRDCIKGWQTGARFPFVITLRESGKLIGMIEIRINSFKADVGYVLSRPYWGNGYAAEALRSLVEIAFSQKEIYRVWAICDVENPASARVLEKVGMQREGILRRNIIHPNISDEPRDCYCYALVK